MPPERWLVPEEGWDELGRGGLVGGPVWPGPAEGQGAAGPAGEAEQRETAETAAARQHTDLPQQTVKYEEVRGELQCVQRELQVAREEAHAGVCVRERLSQDLQVKQAQVCSLEGQLGSAPTLTHTLQKEVKRLEADLEKLQNTRSSGESMLFSTPCWSMTSPRDHNGGRQEERQGYSGGEGDTAAARGTIKHYTSNNSSSSQTLASRPRPHNNKPRARPTGVRPTNQTPPLPRLCFRGNGTTKSLPPGNDSLLLHLPLSPPAMSSDEDRMLGVVGWWRTSGESQTVRVTLSPLLSLIASSVMCSDVRLHSKHLGLSYTVCPNIIYLIHSDVWLQISL
ncbi:uncharacterized protein LOC129827222 [Salvelinus fontinalis]|uniref:uncharacterized protein LOC129827222 n=1 Tax=Salvelinus fontinalis TaxID=8038 RepID=UPI0024855F87|nr:uncharacterized protein LOC129827222 [Salvelinus fontinalis]